MAGDQLSGAARQTHPQLPANFQDAFTFRLVGSVCVHAHPVPAASNPRAQVLLGLQTSDILHAPDAYQILAQPKVADFAHPGAAEEPGNLVHVGI